MRTARRVTGRRHGVAVLVAVGFAVSVAVAPTGHRVVAEEPVIDPAPTTVPESPPTEPTVPAEPTTEPTVPAEPTTEPTVPAEPTTEPTVPAETTTEPRVPAEPSAEPAAGGQDTTSTVAEITTVSTTIQPPTGDPEAAPAARNAPFAAASALTGRSLTITDLPFSVSPATLAFGSYFVDARAFEPVMITNDTGRELNVDVYGIDGVSMTGIGGCGDFVLPPPAVGSTASLNLAVDEQCEVFIDLDTSALGTVNGKLVVTDTDSTLTATVNVNVTAEIVPPDPPANDDWESAEPISGITIPAWVGEPGPFGNQQPRDTVPIDGNTTYATYEAGEYDPGQGGGSVWYEYTPPLGGFSGRLGYRATPGFFVLVTTANESATEWRLAKGNSATPAINFVRMEPGHTIWFSVFTESLFVDPGAFTLELFQAPNEQDSIANAYNATGAGEFALVDDFNLFGDGGTHHLTPDLGGEPNGWSTLRFAVPGTLSVTYRSATASSPGGPFDPNEGSERPLGLRIYRSPQATAVNDPTVLGAVAVGVGEITTDASNCCISGSWWETTATVAVTPGRYYWAYEEDPLGPTFFIFDVRFRAATTVDTEPPTATITTPPDGARYAVGSVPPSVVSTCTDNQGATSSFVTVDGRETTSLATTVGSHTVSLECTDSAGNTTSVTSTYTVFVPDVTAPVITITGVSAGAVLTSASPTLTITSTEPLFGATCTLTTPLPGGGSSINDVGCLADGLSSDTLTLPDLPDGVVTFTVSAVDAAGNRGQSSVTFSVSAPPVVTITNPADGAELLPAQVPSTVQYTCTDNSGVVSPDVEVLLVLPGGSVVLTGPPPSTVGSHTVRVLCFDEENTEGVGEATYTVISDGSGPCVIVDTRSVDFGDVAVGSTSSTRQVVVRSCSDAPIRLAVNVSNATGGGQTWLAGTSTVPADNQFTWSVTPPGAPSPIPVGPIQTAVGPILAPAGSRTDAHRVALGPTGPGLGTRFSSTFTYTALTP